MGGCGGTAFDFLALLDEDFLELPLLDALCLNVGLAFLEDLVEFVLEWGGVLRCGVGVFAMVEIEDGRRYDLDDHC
jgi:hypothetical protein